MPRDNGKWLGFRREIAQARLRLFCFPFGGGGASIFARWQAGMPAGVEVCPVQPPGRENRIAEALVTRMPQMVAMLADVLSPYLDLPVALFGHSVGALTAFELARQWRRQGLRPPEWLFVAGHPAPDLPRRRPYVSHLERTEFVKAMRNQFEVDQALLDAEELMEMIFPALRADYELVETYDYQDEPPLAVPISAFGGSRDPEATAEELLAWKRQTTGPFRSQTLEGNHMFINSSRDSIVKEVGHDLALCLGAGSRS
jgi:medium-chain acyl-[acyl-carrier-protein] hydrolase